MSRIVSYAKTFERRTTLARSRRHGPARHSATGRRGLHIGRRSVDLSVEWPAPTAPATSRPVARSSRFTTYKDLPAQKRHTIRPADAIANEIVLPCSSRHQNRAKSPASVAALASCRVFFFARIWLTARLTLRTGTDRPDLRETAPRNPRRSVRKGHTRRTAAAPSA